MPSSPKSRHVEIQARDLQILRGLFESRIMTAKHVADIYFGGRYEAARKRLQGLKAGGFVRERPRRVYEPAILFLTKRAFAVLCERGTIADLPHLTWAALEKRVRVSELTLRHELAVQDVKAAFHRAVAERPDLALAEFSTWPLLYQFEAFNPAGQRVAVKPDGFLRIRERMQDGRIFEHTFFLEVDRSTETLSRLVERALLYRDYYRRGGLAERNAERSDDRSGFPFRVLMVLRTPARRDHVARALLSARPPVRTQVWLTTVEEAASLPLGEVWTRPVDVSGNRPADAAGSKSIVGGRGDPAYAAPAATCTSRHRLLD